MNMSNLLCGVDVGGTKLALGIINDSDGSIVDKIVTSEHKDKSEEKVIEILTRNIILLLKRNRLTLSGVQGIGIGFAAHIRYREGKIITTANLKGFKDYPLLEKMKEKFSTKIVLDNDANAQAFAEFRYGAGRQYEDMIFITVSTGIGAGIIINNKIYRGVTGTAGEIGHTIVNPFSTIQCGCGNYGCLISHAAGMSLPQMAQKKILEGYTTDYQLDHQDVQQFDGKMVKEGLNRNDPLSLAIMEEYAEYLGIGLYNVFQVFNPPVIVLGGGLLNWGDEYLGKAKDTFYRLAKNMLFDEISIKRAEMEENAALIGAAALLMEQE